MKPNYANHSCNCVKVLKHIVTIFAEVNIMKTRLLILSAFLLTIFGNTGLRAQMKMSSLSENTRMKVSSLPETIVKPAFEGSVAGIYLKVWIMSVTKDLENIVLNNKVKDDGDEINDTHDVLVEVADKNGKTIPDENVKLLMVTPSGKKESLDLDPKSDQYGGSIAFTETGEYHFTVSVNSDGRPAERTFDYKIYR